jgi:hypothetical protein
LNFTTASALPGMQVAGCGPLNQYKPPLTGHEKRVSGMQRFQEARFVHNQRNHEHKLKNIKSGAIRLCSRFSTSLSVRNELFCCAGIDTSPPKSMQREGMSSWQHDDIRRKLSIAVDNVRLLQRLTDCHGLGALSALALIPSLRFLLQLTLTTGAHCSRSA